MVFRKFNWRFFRGILFPFVAALFMSPSLFAEGKRPLLPGYLPDQGEIFGSIGLGYSEGSSSASGTGVFAHSSFNARSSSTGLGLGLVYGVSEGLKASVGVTNVVSVTLSGDGTQFAETPTGWMSPDLGLIKVVEFEDRSRIELGLTYRPKIDSSPLRNYSGGALSANYSRPLSKDFWFTGGLAYGGYSGDRPDYYSLSLGLARGLNSMTLAGGLGLTKVENRASPDGFTRQDNSTSPSLVVSLSSDISKGTYWVVTASHSKGRSITRHLVEEGAATSRQESTGLTLSLFRQFP